VAQATLDGLGLDKADSRLGDPDKRNDGWDNDGKWVAEQIDELNDFVLKIRDVRGSHQFYPKRADYDLAYRWRH
jgi:hypothetical protein